MSVFSERCRQLLAESESNVYEIANESGLERTTLQRMVTGKRLPNLSFVQRFFSFLRLTLPEQDELLDLYWIEKIGRESWQNRRYIRNMIETISLCPDFDERSTLPPRFLAPSLTEESGDTFTDSAYDTENLLEDVILSEFRQSGEKTLCTNLPAACKSFFSLLENLKRMAGSHIRIRHLFIINKVPSRQENSSYNLEALCRILPLLGKFPDIYLPRYVYSRSTPGDDYCYLYPYYLITSRHILLLSSDCTRGILHTNAALLHRYQEEFNRLYSLAAPLAVCHTSDSDSRQLLMQAFAENTAVTHAAADSVHLQIIKALAGSEADIIKYYGPQKSCMFPETFLLLLHGFTRLQLCLLGKENRSMTVTVTESSICKSFLDFLESLDESAL